MMQPISVYLVLDKYLRLRQSKFTRNETNVTRELKQYLITSYI